MKLIGTEWHITIIHRLKNDQLPHTLSRFSRGSSERVITRSSSPETRWSRVGPDSELDS